MENKYVIGIDIGGTNFRIGAVDKEGHVFSFLRLPVESVLKSEDVLLDLSRYLQGYMAKLPGQAEAVAIGFPAPLDKARKTVLQAPNLPYMENLAVTDRLSALLALPVIIERDVNMALCYDMKRFSIPSGAVTCAFYFGTGIGNAIFINGMPYVGRNGAAGELGHIPVDGSEELCGCGNTGCMENLAGGKYLRRLQREKYPDTPISLLFARHGQDDALRLFVDRMAQTVATELNILDPDHVLIGGGVVNMEGFPKELLSSLVKKHARKPFPAENLSIIYTGDEEEKGVAGAAFYAYSRL